MLTVPKKELYLVLPFFGKISALVKAGLTRSLHKSLPFCKVKIAFKTSNRLKNYFSLTPQTGKHLKGTLSTSVRDHMLDRNHVVAWDDFKVLGTESNHWLLEIKRSLFIKRDRPLLNKNIYSQEMSLL